MFGREWKFTRHCHEVLHVSSFFIASKMSSRGWKTDPPAINPCFATKNPPLMMFLRYQPPAVGNVPGLNSAAKLQQDEDPKDPNRLADSLNGVNDWHSHSWVGCWASSCRTTIWSGDKFREKTKNKKQHFDISGMVAILDTWDVLRKSLP